MIIIRKIFLKILGRSKKYHSLNRVLLSVNDLKNNMLKKKIEKSFENRIFLYGEGGTRLSNDPDIDVYYRWPRQGSVVWAEIPAFCIQALLMFSNRKVLDLGCANGWYYREFYSNIDNLTYIGCDLSDDVINEAKKKLKKIEKNKRKNLNATFVVADMTKNMPCEQDDLTNVFWFASMCMFTKEQRKDLLLLIKNKMKKHKGILSGSAMQKEENKYQWQYYISLYDSKEQLYEELKVHFKNVYITHNSTKNSLFFMASDGKLPFYSN